MEFFNLFFTLFKMAFQLAVKIIKPLITILIKTGFWLFIIIFVLIGMNYDFCKKFFILPDTLLILSFLYGGYKTTELVMRFIKKDPTFQIFNFGFSKGAVDPVVKEFISNSPQGFIFGKRGSNFAVKPETVDGHILAIGGAGSGKSSCLAIPTLLSWNSRVFAIDIKGELSEKAQKKRPNIKIFDPDDDNSLGYDPFYILKADPSERVQNTREIVLALVPLPPNTKDPFWIQAAQNLLTGTLLFFNGQGLSFIEAITEMQEQPPKSLVTMIMDSEDKDARRFVSQYSGIDERTLGGIASQLSNSTMIFATDSSIKKALSKENNITPDLLETGSDIFIKLSEHRLEQWKSLLTLMISQFLKHFERRKEGENIAPILFLLDEFARLGKIEPITNGLATLRSKKVTISILTQSLAQLDMIYGKEARQVIADNCSFKAILKATDGDTQEYFSKLVGTYDRLKKSSSSSKKGFDFDSTAGNSTTTEEKRIIKPEEFAYLEQIILLTPKGFMKVDKAPYYKEKSFIS